LNLSEKGERKNSLPPISFGIKCLRHGPNN
jgi:hypothetical protein